MPNNNSNKSHDRNSDRLDRNQNRGNSRNSNNNDDLDTFNEGLSKNLVKKLDDDNSTKIKIHNYSDKYSNTNYGDESLSNSPRNGKKNLEEYEEDFFSEDNDDHENKTSKADKSFFRSIIFMITILGLTITVIILSFSLKSTKDNLALANAELSNLLDTQQDAERKLAEEALQSENDSLKAELDSLKDPNDTTSNSTSNNNNNSTSSNNSNNNTTSTNSNGTTSYTVQAGDSSIWDISKKLYGNGAYFQNILDANGLKDGDILKEGQVLVIPKLD